LAAPTDSKEITVNPSAALGPVGTPQETVDELIARVLRRAYGAMEALTSPNEARAVRHVAHSFADELAALDPRFDRVQFIRDATEGPS
jgi:hypothetical protein